jgi:hypothetical protein
MATEMALVHNIFIRALNSMYLQGPLITKEEDISDFFIFCQTWVQFVEHHHHNEEENFFPDLELLHADMQLERDQHKAIHVGLDEFMNYVTTTAPKDFKWVDMKAVMDSFVPVFCEHLTQEIKTLIALKDSKMTEAQLKAAWGKAEKAAINTPLPSMFVSYTFNQIRRMN